MRLLVEMNARMDAAYNHAYHGNLRGVVWNRIRGTEYDKYHREDTTALPISFSNPFPFRDMNEGDTRKLLFASHEEEILGHLAESFSSNPEVNIGEMPFRVTDQTILNTDVGEPGTSGTLLTDTGVVVTFSPAEMEEYGLDSDHDCDTFWRSDHSVEPFFDSIETNLAWKASRVHGSDAPDPDDLDHDLFEGFEFIKPYSLPVEVATGETRTFVLSKWEFDYTVKSDAHRRLLNTLLRLGIGERNTLGFGFVNPASDERITGVSL